MKIIKDKKILEDSWQLLFEVESSLPDGDVMLPFAYWKEHQSDLEAHSGQVTVFLNGADELDDVVPHIQQFELIGLQFPAFADGRSYSHARLLRDRYGFSGELRALGDVLRDQLFYMLRCGIDSFALREDKDFEDVMVAFDEFSVTYQTAADGALPIYKVR